MSSDLLTVCTCISRSHVKGRPIRKEMNVLIDWLNKSGSRFNVLPLASHRLTPSEIVANEIFLFDRDYQEVVCILPPEKLSDILSLLAL